MHGERKRRLSATNKAPATTRYKNFHERLGSSGRTVVSPLCRCEYENGPKIAIIIVQEGELNSALVEDSTQSTRRALRGEVGLLRLAYSGSAAEAGILTKVTRAFRQACSEEVDIRAQEMHPKQQVAALMSGDIDAGLMPTRAFDLPAELKVTRLGAWPLLLALPDNHPLLRSRSISIADIDAQPFVICAASDDDDGTAIFRQALGFSPIVAHRVPTVIMVTALVGAGLGLGVLPASMALAAKQAGAVLRPMKGIDIETDVSLVTRSIATEPVVERLLECTQVAFKKP